MKHTPGKWETGENKKGSFSTCVYGKDFWLQVQANAASPFTDEEILKANAHLIAAAPELLELLKKAIENLEFGGEPKTPLGHAIREFQNEARQAIAKVEGNQ